ncbi:MAG: glycosyltransferase, partial [Methyloprofundus sp.]|nr:glycosyltransferase [Methyloprofundus sp.]
MKNFKISLIILNWNGCNDTLECLNSVQKIHYPNLDIIVADNGSTDSSLELIKKDYPTVSIIENGENLGFAGGNNRAIEHA